MDTSRHGRIEKLSMSPTKQASKRNRRRKAAPILGAAGLSLSLASAATAATDRLVTDTQARNTGARHEIILGEEEIADVSLATFYVLDKESAAASRPRMRLAIGGACAGCSGCGGCGCWTGTDYTTSLFGNQSNPPHQATSATRKQTHASKPGQAPKNPQ
jgi:hypothetical protein